VFAACFHHRDTENTEVAQRRIYPVDPSFAPIHYREVATDLPRSERTANMARETIALL